MLYYKHAPSKRKGKKGKEETMPQVRTQAYRTMLSILLCLFMFFSLGASSVFGEEGGTGSASGTGGETQLTEEPAATAPAANVTAPKETKLAGVPKSFNRTPKKALRFSVTVSPSTEGRSLLLQRYDSSKKKWVTIHRYKSKKGASAKVSMQIEAKYRKKTTGKWRIVVEATPTAKAYTAKSFTVTAANLDKRKLTARSACVYCVDSGEFLFRKNSKARRAPASLTKMMTALVLMDSGKINKSATVSKRAAGTLFGSLNMTPGDRYRYKDLLYAMLMPSANDAAAVVAEGLAGSQRKFAVLMNKKAKELGMKNTRFVNPHGLDAKGQYTTAEDMARLTAAAYGNKTIRKVWNCELRTIRSLRYGESNVFGSTNVLPRSKKFKGGKTGTTDKAGCCFAGVYVHGGRTYVTVVLGSDYGTARWRDTKVLQAYIRKHGKSRY